MYICNDCGHTFLTPIESSEDVGDETVYGCKLCESDNYQLYKREKPERTYWQLIDKAQTLYGVWMDYLKNWDKLLTPKDKDRIVNHMRRLTLMSAYYLKQIRENNL